MSASPRSERFTSTSDATTAFKLQQGTSARNGIFSAQLAKAGWTGPSDALQGEFGTDFLFLKYNIESKRYQLLVATPE